MQESLVLFTNCVVEVDSSDVADVCAGLFSTMAFVAVVVNSSAEVADTALGVD